MMRSFPAVAVVAAILVAGAGAFRRDAWHELGRDVLARHHHRVLQDSNDGDSDYDCEFNMDVSGRELPR